ncbi:hypothetical protein QQ045_019314 [Rhodiola kirilowii]
MKGLATTSPFLLIIIFFLFDASSCRLLLVDPISPPTAVSPTADPNEPATYIVLTVKPPANDDINHFALRILSRVTGGEKTASYALIYTYAYGTISFAAKVTLDQLSVLAKQPEVIAVIKDRSVHLDRPSIFSR